MGPAQTASDCNRVSRLPEGGATQPSVSFQASRLRFRPGVAGCERQGRAAANKKERKGTLWRLKDRHFSRDRKNKNAMPARSRSARRAAEKSRRSWRSKPLFQCLNCHPSPSPDGFSPTAGIRAGRSPVPRSGFVIPTVRSCHFRNSVPCAARAPTAHENGRLCPRPRMSR